MDLVETHRFSGKVYTRRNLKTQKKEDVSPPATTAAAVETPADVTKVSKTLDSAKVTPLNQNLWITDSTSGDVPEGDVELREDSCVRVVVGNGSDNGGGNEMVDRSLISRVRVRFNEWRSVAEIRNVRRRLEGELHHVRRLVKKVEAKEKLQRTELKHTRFTGLDVMNNPNLARPVDLPTPFPPPSHASIANSNPVDNGIVEREKRTRKESTYYNASEYLLAKDRLPREINKKSKKSKNERKYKVFRNRKNLPTMSAFRTARFPWKDKRDMTNEEMKKLNRDLESLPPEEVGEVTEIVKKRGVTYKQNNTGELELDIDSVDAVSKAEVAQNALITSTSGSMVDAALKESTSGGEMRTSIHVEGGREADNGGSDSGSSSSDFDSDSSSS